MFATLTSALLVVAPSWAPPSDRCREWGPERAACVQETPHELQVRSGTLRSATLRPEDLEGAGYVRLPVFWLGSRIDRPQQAARTLADSAPNPWRVRPTRHYREDLEAGAEVLWFRLPLEVDPALVGVPLAMAMPGTGAAEVYVDGQLVKARGRVAPPSEVVQDGYGEPFVFRFREGGGHVVAVRWSAAPVVRDRRIDYTPAFRIMIGHPADLFAHAARFERQRVALTVASAAFPVALALLHLCLWFFRRRGNGDLIYASFALSVAVVTALPLTFELVWSWSSITTAWMGFRAAVGILAASTVAFHLHLAGGRWPALRWPAHAASGALVLASPWISNDAVFVFVIAMVVVALAILAASLGRRQAQIHAVGIAAYLVGTSITTLAALDVIEVGPLLIDAHVFGVPVLLTAMAVALSWEVGETQRKLRQHAEEVERLSRAEVRHEAKRTEAVVRLVAGLTHELNSPLGALRSSLDVIRRGVDRLHGRLDEGLGDRPSDGRGDSTGPSTLDPAMVAKIAGLQRDACENGEAAVARVSGLVRSLDELVQLDEAERREYDLHEGLDAALRWLDARNREGIEVRKRYGAIPRLMCRPRALNRAFSELLENAVAAIHARGETGVIELVTQHRDGHVRLTIRDDGVGMTAEERERLFDAGFKRGARVELGLGLLAVQRVVASHGGRIEVQTAPGAGATFVVVLPVAVASSRAESSPTSTPPASSFTGATFSVTAEAAPGSSR